METLVRFKANMTIVQPDEHADSLFAPSAALSLSLVHPFPRNASEVQPVATQVLQSEG